MLMLISSLAGALLRSLAGVVHLEGQLVPRDKTKAFRYFGYAARDGELSFPPPLSQVSQSVPTNFLFVSPRSAHRQFKRTLRSRGATNPTRRLLFHLHLSSRLLGPFARPKRRSQTFPRGG